MLKEIFFNKNILSKQKNIYIKRILFRNCVKEFSYRNLSNHICDDSDRIIFYHFQFRMSIFDGLFIEHFMSDE